MFRKVIIIATMAVIAVSTAAPVSAATTDKGLVKAYCVKCFQKSPIYVKSGSAAIENHQGKMIVEVVKSKSLGGKYGKTKDGYRVKYTKRVKRGKTITSYLIYDPRTNNPDDIAAVVDNKRIK